MCKEKSGESITKYFQSFILYPATLLHPHKNKLKKALVSNKYHKKQSNRQEINNLIFMVV